MNLFDHAATLIYRGMGTLLRPLDDRAAHILFDAADELAEAEAEREAWEANELLDGLSPEVRAAYEGLQETVYGFTESSCDPVEDAPVAPGVQESPGAAAASQRAASGQPTTGDLEWDEFIRRIVREEIDRVFEELDSEPYLRDES